MKRAEPSPARGGLAWPNEPSRHGSKLGLPSRSDFGRMRSRTRTRAPRIPFKSFIFDLGRMLSRNSLLCLKKRASPSASRAMATKQVTTMVIKVDLECEKCHKKIKKVLCKIPREFLILSSSIKTLEIQNQIYDKKANTVTITVVCCSPEKIKKKICCKGGEAVKGIEIKVPKPNPVPVPAAPVPAPKPDPKPNPVPAPPAPKPVAGFPPVPDHPRTCCSECYQGFGGGPCYHGYGRPTPQCYEPYGRPVYDSWGCSCRSRGYYVCRCEYVCENDPSSCTIM
ncbi:unnamed protein product [Dovyalis caffra]|uniref:Uncharacterized protein n=1 Tax=Dovyalis caffra TaxID=77055 RepID=A0AAV1QR63_9ROSI|nr:unnamed protein product [Dovyalis caffra]